MILTLHRRYPNGDHWEVDPTPMGSITIEGGKITLDMKETPIKSQIKRLLDRPITYIRDSFGEDPYTALKVVDKDSEEYIDALIYELRKIGLEARKRYEVMV